MLTATDLNTRDAIMSDLEGLWRCWDQLLGSFMPEDWRRKHGKDWTFADVPYHMYYFDRDIVARPIERGLNVPESEQQAPSTMSELDAWNAARFAERPEGQTAEESLAQWRSVRGEIRRVVGSLTDAGLEAPTFVPMSGMGWVTARDALVAGRAHTWSELVQLKIHAGASQPEPPDTATHAVLGFYVWLLSQFLDRAEAEKTHFTAVMEFAGRGGGAWTLRVADGRCEVTEGWTEGADFVMTQSPESFVKTLNNIRHPLIGILTREIKVKGIAKMGTFGKLFPPPGPSLEMPWNSTPPQQQERVPAKSSKDVVLEYLRGISGEDLSVLDRLVGDEKLKQDAAVMRSAFPDVHYAVGEIAEEGDQVAAQLDITGTHEGLFYGVEPTGKRIEAHASGRFRIEAGRIAEASIQRDDAAILRQLGAEPVPGTFDERAA